LLTFFGEAKKVRRVREAPPHLNCAKRRLSGEAAKPLRIAERDSPEEMKKATHPGGFFNANYV
jgi:hypothetical protein